MAINRGSISKELLPGLNAVFGVEYGEVSDEHAPLFDTENSDRAFEEEVLFTGFGTAPVKGEGAAVSYDDAQESYTARYTHETVALGFAITEEAMEDNLYDTFAKLRAKGLARAMANTKQVKAADVFNNGFNSSYAGGDGQPLFSASHGTIGNGDQSNLLSAADLSEASLETALIAISKIKDDRGILIGAQAESLHIPSDLAFTADQILNSALSTTIVSVLNEGSVKTVVTLGALWNREVRNRAPSFALTGALMTTLVARRSTTPSSAIPRVGKLIGLLMVTVESSEGRSTIKPASRSRPDAKVTVDG